MNTGTKKIIQGLRDSYVLDNNFRNISGNAQWTYATGSNGKRYFIKKFYAPVFPKNREMYTAESYIKVKSAAEKFYREKFKIYQRVNNANTGNNVIVSDFFLNSDPNDGHYYAVSEKMETSRISVEDVHWMPEKDKLLLIKLVLNNFKQIHEQGIVYADVRKDNILLVQSQMGKTIPKLIDFDGSYIEEDQDYRDPIPISENYISPEAYKRAFENEAIKISVKSDIFSLGLLFHEYFTGHLPRIPNGIKYASSAVMKGYRLKLDESIPEWLRDIMNMMLQARPELRPSAEEIRLMIDKKEIINIQNQPQPQSNTKTTKEGIRVHFGSFSK